MGTFLSGKTNYLHVGGMCFGMQGETGCAGSLQVIRPTSAGASQQILGKSSVRDDYQLKALKALMISTGFLMRICEGGIASLKVKRSVKIPAVC